MFGNKPAREVDVKDTPIRIPERAPERPTRDMEPHVEQKNHSVFGKGSRMNGTLKCEGGIRVDGEFEGQIETNDTLVVGKEGHVRANAKVKRAVIGGRFEGNIELHSGCEMLGEVDTPSLVIEEGVVFEGTCKMGTTKGSTRMMAQAIARDAATASGQGGHGGQGPQGGQRTPATQTSHGSQNTQGSQGSQGTTTPSSQPTTYAQKS
jgi:cytoskeletal protein CcmA (bactofilin family)